ncbi:aspartate/glutamate racemase family protein [Pusillimonas sp. ANT_WB101]|uniref:aspartate/glutamate racemase family protein n=1 Tax=Pusillimonas sp. ANT_WB101 TaxID=2597356 RepID=UPI0011EDE535|nr:aspartate/glutamate racemase family protein [Pusillimonas sp. ANT_WB101]KAA0911210.1 aspartate/glutamate racemase family protein [Pusillimonas sp. ANT_WB101]NYT77058.1 aspartate/glutamate racemase family protein [Alcaligenaceae bacterium]
MKTIGLLGGMSWESTAHYYRDINQGVRARLGGLHSARIAMYSVDFEEIEKLQNAGDWVAAGVVLAEAAARVEAAGADFLVLCTNTMHKVADDISNAVSIPLLHIADATGDELQLDGIETVGLLGTAFTMQQGFYKDRLALQSGMRVLVPDDADQQVVHRIIYDELCQGVIRPESKRDYLRIIDKLAEQGAEAVILGCTEIGMLVEQADTPVKLFDTTRIHAQRAVAMALAK